VSPPWSPFRLEIDYNFISFIFINEIFKIIVRLSTINEIINFRNISPSESKFLSILTCGEGWHNYHHTFSWDYKAAELGHYRYNLCTAFIDFFAFVGWAYDLKTVPWKIVLNRVKRTGDGSYENYKYHSGSEEIACDDNFDEKLSGDSSHNLGTWGWGDKDIAKRDLEVTEILCRKRS